MKLSNKIIVLTGGTSGIGRKMVDKLQAHNTLAVIARESPRLQALRDTFPNVDVHAADLSDPQNYGVIANSILETHPRIDVLINNAAVQNVPTFLDKEFDYATIEHEIHVNFTSVCALSYLLLPALTHGNEEAAIANINSGLALTPKKTSVIYCATKAALNAFSQGLSYQLEGTNVQVLQAFLPLVDTPMTTGRGTGKITVDKAASEILLGIEQGKKVNDVGKVKLLRLLLRLAPALAGRIMRKQ
ncbi:SDR family oxidoreductase [Emcibacter nanhaiensis]|uniref:SDR family NAD(P)-dependent oxidoreductase n=1 Tax=Emcibacter nanhaiensis TaxID=1505037 RepID=A0A501PH35_9PROT|nr:SDR family NAD(P)-dependent oxidoreductase [Emcibacter nanhaiensis]TPD59264.1 SDR family NAD(P)-dependent oxidoreductase [Emcibacter nanhaiensis]